MNANLDALHQAATECMEALEHAYNERHRMLKNSEQPSPGLLEAIKHLEAKRVTILKSIELWKGFLTAYPGYDRV